MKQSFLSKKRRELLFVFATITTILVVVLYLYQRYSIVSLGIVVVLFVSYVVGLFLLHKRFLYVHSLVYLQEMHEYYIEQKYEMNAKITLLYKLHDVEQQDIVTFAAVVSDMVHKKNRVDDLNNLAKDFKEQLPALEQLLTQKNDQHQKAYDELQGLKDREIASKELYLPLQPVIKKLQFVESKLSDKKNALKRKIDGMKNSIEINSSIYQQAPHVRKLLQKFEKDYLALNLLKQLVARSRDGQMHVLSFSTQLLQDVEQVELCLSSIQNDIYTISEIKKPSFICLLLAEVY